VHRQRDCPAALFEIGDPPRGKLDVMADRERRLSFCRDSARNACASSRLCG
jgi:hypothetical protein